MIFDNPVSLARAWSDAGYFSTDVSVEDQSSIAVI